MENQLQEQLYNNNDENQQVLMLLQVDEDLESTPYSPSQLSNVNLPLNDNVIIIPNDIYIENNIDNSDILQLVDEECNEPSTKYIRLSELKPKRGGFQSLAKRLEDSRGKKILCNKEKTNLKLTKLNSSNIAKQYVVTSEKISSLRLENPKNEFSLPPNTIPFPSISNVRVPETIKFNNAPPKINFGSLTTSKSGNFVPFAQKKHSFITKKPIPLQSNILPKKVNPNKDSVVYDPNSNSKMVYRVVYPEDLNLYTPTEAKKKRVRHKEKSNRLNFSENTKILSTTRSGRQVRLPRHMATNYDKPDAHIKDQDSDFGLDIDSNLDFENVISSKKRLACPACQKSYNSIKTLARHLFTLPDHATTEKTVTLLEEYKNELKTVKTVETQTDFDDSSVQTINISNNVGADKVLPSEKKSVVNPTSKRRDERSLFSNLIRMLEHAPEENRIFVFIRQLTTLVIKLHRLLPCLMHKEPDSPTGTINEALGRLLNLDPGKYKLNMNAISCARMPLGKCSHSPAGQSSNITNPIINSQWAPETSHIVPKNDNQSMPLPKWNSNNLWVNNDNNSILKDNPKDQNYRISTPVAWSETNNSWLQKSRENVNNSDEFINSATTSIDKWTTPDPKPKWIPVGSREIETAPKIAPAEWLGNNSNIILSSNIKETMANVETWTENLKQLNEPDQESWPNPSIDDIANNVSVNMDKNTIPFSCTEKLIHSDLVFNIKNQKEAPQKILHSESVEHFNFNTNEFDMQIDAANISFTGDEFESLKYSSDTLPPFQKIDQGNKLQLPVENFNMMSNGDKLHLSQSNSNMLEPSNFPITSDALDLNLDNTCSINTNVESCTTVTLSNEKIIRPTPLSEADLILPISDSDSISRTEPILPVNETSLDENRLNISSSQSVLHLLDPLGSDCLSFSDSELRPSSQMPLDLQLDLFQFQHQ